MDQRRDNERPENSERMTLGERVTFGLVIDTVFGFIFLAASALAPTFTVLILAVVSVAAVWVWAHVMYRIRTGETQAKSVAKWWE